MNLYVRRSGVRRRQENVNMPQISPQTVTWRVPHSTVSEPLLWGGLLQIRAWFIGAGVLLALPSPFLQKHLC